MTEETESRLWENSLFVFDASALLNFYEYSPTSRKDIYTNIFSLLSERLWITGQNQFEFQKRKSSVVKKPYSLYAELKEKFYPKNALKEFLAKYDDFKGRTSKADKHPYVDIKIYEAFDVAIRQLKAEEEALVTKLNIEFSQQIEAHDIAIEEDNLESFFQVTDNFSFQEMMIIAREGEFRYRHKIPPGYADENDKKGMSKFGDLISWKQIMKLAKDTSKSIVLVIDDNKEDWCITDKKDKSKILSPRHELIKEMLDETGCQFWIYNSATFVYKAALFLKSTVSASAINDVNEVVKSKVEDIEQAVLRWAEKTYNVDETILAKDFWKKDTGADIIQTLDGVPFSIRVKFIDSALSLRKIDEILLKMKDIDSNSFIFEVNIIVLVTDNLGTASHLLNHAESILPDFKIVTGCLNFENEFVSLNK